MGWLQVRLKEEEELPRSWPIRGTLVLISQVTSPQGQGFRLSQSPTEPRQPGSEGPEAGVLPTMGQATFLVAVKEFQDSAAKEHRGHAAACSEGCG